MFDMLIYLCLNKRELQPNNEGCDLMKTSIQILVFVLFFVLVDKAFFMNYKLHCDKINRF